MKKVFLLLIGLCCSVVMWASFSKTVNLITAGTLSTTLKATELTTVTHLTLTGPIDARDFKTMRDKMTVLVNVTLSGATIVEYSGTDGTAGSGSQTYPAATIPANAFNNNANLTSIVLPSTLTGIGDNAFLGCSKLTTAALPSTLTTIGAHAFQGTALTAVTIPASVTSVGNYAFCETSAAFTVDAANTAFLSENSVLYNKAQTELLQAPLSISGSFAVPENVTTIGLGAFMSCSKLTSITFPSSLTTISKQAFSMCSGLGALTISSSVTAIGELAFAGSGALFTVDAANAAYSSALGVLYNKDKSELKQASTKLSGSFSVPNTVTAIAAGAFWNATLLKSVTLPASVKTIDSKAFYNCTGLKNIISNNPVPSSLLGTYWFTGIPTATPLYVPIGSKIAYSASSWSFFTNINEFNSSGNNALDFDGIDNYVLIQDIAKLNLTINYTIEAWIKPEIFGDYLGIVSKYHNASSDGYALRLRAGAGIDFNNKYVDGVLVLNQWQHIAAVCSNGVLSLYVNGVLKPLLGTAYQTKSNFDYVTIGVDYMPQRSSRQFSGGIDEVRIWDVARPKDSIIANMNKSLTTASNLVANYSFNQGVAGNDNTWITAVNDVSGNDLGGVPQGFTLKGTTSNFVPFSNMLAYYPFDGDAQDKTGNNNHLTLPQAGSLVLTADRFGKTNAAALFNNNANYLKMPASVLSGRKQFSVSFWINTKESRTKETDEYARPTIFGDASANGVSGDLQIVSDGGKIGLYNGLTAPDHSAVSYPINDSAWHFVACTYNGNSVKLFVDGVKTYQKDTSNAKVDNLDKYLMACNSGGSSALYNHTGILDDFRVYDAALLDDDVVRLYKEIKTPKLSVSTTNNALAFDGKDDYVDCGVINPSQFTVEAWVNVNTIGSIQVIASKLINEAAYYNKNFELRVDADGAVHFCTPGGSQWDEFVSSTKLVAKQWYHIAASCDGTTSKLYINGNLERVLKISATYVTTLTKMYIGARPASTGVDGMFFNGSIDEVRIWNTARSQADIVANINKTIPTAAGLVASYNFNQGLPNVANTDRTLTDASDYKNNGKLSTGFDLLRSTTSNWTTGAPLDYSVNPLSITMPRGASESYASVTSNSAWTATSSAAWLSVSPSSATGNGVLTFSAAVSETDRMATITLRATDATLPNKTINLTQLATTLKPAETSKTIAAALNSQIQIKVDANIPWTATTTATWLKVVPNVGSGVITFTTTTATAPNTAATITLSGGGLTKTISITQAPAYIEPANALSFDGNGDYVTTPDNDDAIATSKAFTIETWVKWQPNKTDDIQFICGNAYERMELHTCGGAGANGLRFIPFSTATYCYNAKNVLPTGVWTHVAAVFDSATKKAQIYINGQAVKTDEDTKVASAYNKTAEFRIGARNHTTPFYFKGAIDELRVWSVARTQAQIQENMNKTLGETAGLVQSFNFNRGIAAGDNTTDKDSLFNNAGKTLHGKLVGFARTGKTSNWIESYAKVVPAADAATDISATGFTAKWNAPSVGVANSYLLYVATDSAFTTPIAATPITVTTTSAQVSGLTAGTSYFYRVRAIKAGVDTGAYSQTIKVPFILNVTPTPTPITLTKEISSSASVAVVSNAKWSIPATLPAWLSATKDNAGVTFKTLSANDSASIRSCSFVIKTNPEIQSLTKTITVTQAAADSSFSLQSSAITLGSEQGSRQAIKLTANFKWTYNTTTIDWLTVKQNEDSLVFTANSENLFTTKNRDCSIKIQFGTKIQTIKVTQIPQNFSISVSTYAVQFRNTADSATVTVNASGTWIVIGTTTDTWLTFKSSDQKILTLTAQENKTILPRSTTVKVKLKDLDSSQTITITQAAGTPFVTTTKDTLQFSKIGRTASVYFSSNTSWMVTKTAGWISIDGISSSVPGDKLIDITVTKNQTIEPRFDTVKITASGVAPQYIVVYQAAGDTNFTASVDTLRLLARGDTASVSVKSNASWTVSSSNALFVPSLTAGKDTNTFTLFVPENKTNKERITSLRIAVSSKTDTLFSFIQDSITLHRENLQKYIRKADSVLKNSSIGEGHKQFSQADSSALATVLAASKLRAQSDSTQALVDSTATALDAAIDRFLTKKKTVNFAELTALIAQAKDTLSKIAVGSNPCQYAASDTVAFAKVIKAANAIVDRDNITQDSVAKQIAQLKDKQQNFLSTKNAAADKTTLQTAITNANSLLVYAAQYPSDSVAKLNTAITAANAAEQNQCATSDQIATTTSALNKVIENFAASKIIRLTVSPQTITLPAQTTASFVEVAANNSWTATSSAGWLKVNLSNAGFDAASATVSFASQAVSIKKLWIVVAENINDKKDKMVDTVTIVSGNQIKKIVVLQDALITIRTQIVNQYLESDKISVKFNFADCFDYNGSTALRYSIASSAPEVASASIIGDYFKVIANEKGTATLSITATSVYGTTQTMRFVVTVGGAAVACKLTIAGAVTDVACAGSATGAIALTVTGNVSKKVLYKWSNNYTGKDLEGIAQGTYTVVVNDSLCSDSKTFVVNESPALRIARDNENSAKPSCLQSDGVLAAKVSGGTPPYRYAWAADTSKSNRIVSVGADSYVLSVSDAQGCTKVESLQLENNNAPIVLIDSVRETQCNKSLGAISITALGGTPPYRYAWSNGATTANLQGIKNGSYKVTVTDTLDCETVKDTLVRVTSLAQPQIALVTVDSLNRNLIVWERPKSTEIDYYTVYREVTKIRYDSIGYRKYTDTSVLVDKKSLSTTQSSRYKLSATDFCGNKSAYSAVHKTMLLSKTRWNNDVQLSWDSYEGFDFATYTVYRNTKSKKHEAIVQLSANNQEYHDVNAPADVLNYYVAIDLPFEVRPLDFKTDTGPFSQSLSNVSEASLVDNPKLFTQDTEVKMYPNPTTGVVTIWFGDLKTASLTLVDLLGHQIISTQGVGTLTIDCSAYTAGMYLVHIKTADETTTHRLMIE